MQPSFAKCLADIRHLLSEGKKDQALAVVESFLTEHPDSIPALLWYAALTPNLEKGVRALEHVLQLDPGNARAQAGLKELRARLAAQAAAPMSAPTEPPALAPCQPPSREATGGPPSGGRPGTEGISTGEAPQPVSTIQAETILDAARSILWPFRGLNRPIGQLLSEGRIQNKDLAWAAQHAQDPSVRWAAGILLRQEELEGRQFRLEQVTTTVWPYRGLKRPVGELVRTGTVDLGTWPMP